MRLYLWIAAIVVAAVTGGWWLGRGTATSRGSVIAESADADSGNSNTNALSNVSKHSAAHVQVNTSTNTTRALKLLPPPGTPLKQIFDELKARADAGDVQAASRLYHDLSICSGARAAIRSNTLRAENILGARNKTNPVGVQQEQLDIAQRLVKGSEILKALCVDVSSNMMGTLAAVSLEAAQLGDSAARDCYVHRGPSMSPGSLVSDPSSVETYREQAPALVDSAMAAGDWKMVDMLQYAYGPSGTNLISGLVGPDPVQHYRYLKLFRLGADGYRIPALDQQLAFAATQLNAQQLADADIWAQAMQQAYFKGSSTGAVPENWNACAIPSE